MREKMRRTNDLPCTWDVLHLLLLLYHLQLLFLLQPLGRRKLIEMLELCCRRLLWNWWKCL